MLLRVLLRFPNDAKVRVLQGFYRAKSIKPADLLLVNITSDKKQILLELRTITSTVSAIGKACDGSWHTTQLKSTCLLSALLWRLSLRFFEKSQPVPDTGSQWPEWFEKVTRELMSSFNFETTMETVANSYFVCMGRGHSSAYARGKRGGLKIPKAVRHSGASGLRRALQRTERCRSPSTVRPKQSLESSRKGNSVDTVIQSTLEHVSSVLVLLRLFSPSKPSPDSLVCGSL